MASGLMVIDIQNDYFPGGAFPLVDPEDAAQRAAEVLGRFRAAGLPVVHVQHVMASPDAPFFVRGTEGVEIHPLVAPIEGEPVVQKASPNAFLGTGLDELLDDLDVDHLVVVGMQTNLCIDASVRAASDLGHTVTVVGDACAAVGLEHRGRAVPGADVHAAFLAAIDGSYADVVDSEDLLVS
ncbi:cysteine hydrolase family protein [Nocardioides marmoribigeumensis]|uniref:Nicotinamidase-related amidase n=1 Tax=Nocardioides marmoribigeumensis TaxID=433649 RepID=A0ABU2BTD2_9ACTN|nr:cysteine hydrolase family protein [Nocardioides marmoribigeumensis]MDR7361898.1 nicotinamidase-related amidase [Nocardioides marmoribigeumensis]